MARRRISTVFLKPLLAVGLLVALVALAPLPSTSLGSLDQALPSSLASVLGSILPEEQAQALFELYLLLKRTVVYFFSEENLDFLFFCVFGSYSGLGPSFSDIWLLNPGADIDFTTTTDFEDLSAPASDIMEFTDQDRALASDSVATSVFFSFAAGTAVGVTARLVLSPSFWRSAY